MRNGYWLWRKERSGNRNRLRSYERRDYSCDTKGRVEGVGGCGEKNICLRDEGRGGDYDWCYRYSIVCIKGDR